MNNTRIMHEPQPRTELSKDLPYARFVQFDKRPAVFPEEMSKVPKLTQLGLDIERLVFFPTVDVPEDVGMSVGTRGLREQLENLNFFAKTLSGSFDKQYSPRKVHWRLGMENGHIENRKISSQYSDQDPRQDRQEPKKSKKPNTKMHSSHVHLSLCLYHDRNRPQTVSHSTPHPFPD